ncbi:hypothetical protein [Lacinutrix jangbogonensis]|uniref:hypothetical protein n=1 Tax=Lacinutrix jangbogonensis TaxID=1469557 RepID=UPI00053E3B85|nr:hypothetical protein [Lacinutrix jangbogonensis]
MKKLKLVLFAVVLATLNFSCLVDDSTGDDALNALGESSYIVGFSNGTALLSYFEDIGAIEKEFPIDFLGGQDGNLASALTINYSIDPLSSATEGQEFNFVDTSGTVTIAAGGSFAQFPLLVNTGGLDPDVPTELILNLDSVTGADAVISALGDQLKITFVGCQTGLDSFTYAVISVRSDGVTVDQGVADLRNTGPNTLKTRTTGPWGLNSIADDTGLTFTDVCGDLNIDAQNLMETYSNQVTGTNLAGADGQVDANGDFSLSYEITFGTGPLTHIDDYTKL